jgi:2-polyprenyl-6-methoxyphenol hydroxylase-like FAD-dependent oxidoreductase
MSIEDRYVLAACLEKYFDDPSTAFSRYEDIRKDRTAAVVRKAHENKRVHLNRASLTKMLSRPRVPVSGNRFVSESEWSGYIITMRRR